MRAICDDSDEYTLVAQKSLKGAMQLCNTMNEMNETLESTERDLKNPVGAVIKEARKSKKLTQKELALLAKVSHVTLSRIETGDYDPTKSTLQKISPHIGVPYPELLIKAGYNNASGEGTLYDRDGNTLDLLGIVTAVYHADSDLLKCFQGFDKYASEENVKVLEVLLGAMRKEVEATESKGSDEDGFNKFFVNTFRALKRFILETLVPVVG